jgi:hypothetical protein
LISQQLIVLSEDISSRRASARSDWPYKLANLNDGIWRQVMQLNSKLVRNVCKNWMWWHKELGREKVFEDGSFVHTGLGHIPWENSMGRSPSTRCMLS